MLSLDFDNDDHIGHVDMGNIIRSVTRNELSAKDVQFVTDRVRMLCYT